MSEGFLMKRLDQTFRKELITMLRTSDEQAHLDLADDFERAGPHGFATDDEIERFMEIV
jgi:hypothetical protein